MSGWICHCADELYQQMLYMAALIIRKTGTLLAMYDQALFHDAVYFQLIEASRIVKQATGLSQLARIETWHALFNLASKRWNGRDERLVKLELMIVQFDFYFEHALQEMEQAAEGQERSAQN